MIEYQEERGPGGHYIVPPEFITQLWRDRVDQLTRECRIRLVLLIISFAFNIYQWVCK